MVSKTDSLTIGIAQVNPALADFCNNVEQLLTCCNTLYQQGAKLVIAPRMALIGYPVGNLAVLQGFQNAASQSLDRFKEGLPQGISVILSHVVVFDGQCVECVLLIKHNFFQILTSSQQTNAQGLAPIDINGVRVLACLEDELILPSLLTYTPFDLLAVCGATPYYYPKKDNKGFYLQEWAKKANHPLIYCNLAGGQDKNIYQGLSCAIDNHGNLKLELPMFKKAIRCISYQDNLLLPVLPEKELSSNSISSEIGVDSSSVISTQETGELYEALKTGLQDFLYKNKLSRVLVGLSGGMDSALVLTIAADAIGANNVYAVMLPSQFSADISLIDAQQLATNLGVTSSVIPINSAFETFLNDLAPEFKGTTFDVTEENLQARIRAVILMALSNKKGYVLLNTSNKSEAAVGYSTLYGDSTGAFSILKDVYKTTVYQLANYRNSIKPVIPLRIITRAPSAELRPEQTDQQSLPPYEILDAILAAYIDHHLSAEEIVALGFNKETVYKVIELVLNSEFKRRQAPPGINLSSSCVLGDLPITRGFKE